MMTDRCILIVDDEFIILHTLRMQLERSFPQMHIEIASDKEEVKDIVTQIISSKQQLVAVIADYHIGDVKGTEIINMVHHHFPMAAKSILTGIADTKSIESEIPELYHQIRFFQKPWEIDAVVDYLAPLLVEP